MNRIDNYISIAQNNGAKYVIVMCDDFDDDVVYYPVYCYTNEEYADKYEYYKKSADYMVDTITINNNPKFHMELRKNIEKPSRLTY